MTRTTILMVSTALIGMSNTLAAGQSVSDFNPAVFDIYAPIGELDKRERDLIRDALDSGVYDEGWAFGMKGELSNTEQEWAPGNVPTDKVVVLDPPGECDKIKSVYFQKSISGFPILSCEKDDRGNFPGASGAALSIADDREANETSLSVDAGLGVVLIPPAQMENSEVDFGLMGFVEANFEDSDKDYARAGFNAEFMFDADPLDFLVADVTTYYQTDFDHDLKGYGVQVSLFPQLSDLALNLAVVDPKSPFRYAFLGSATVDYLRLENPGNTELGPEENFAWIGGEVGVLLEYDDVLNGVSFKPTLQYFWDPLSERDAALFNAGLSFKLDEDGTSSLTFGYSRGRDRQTFVFEDKFTADLELKLSY